MNTNGFTKGIEFMIFITPNQFEQILFCEKTAVQQKHEIGETH
jgi:hypothetical protein